MTRNTDRNLTIETPDSLHESSARTLRETGSLPAKDIAPWAVSHGKTVPVVGAGATFGSGSDSYPFTVVAVSKSGHRVTLRRDEAKVISGTWRSGDAKCVFLPGSGDGGLTASRRNNLKLCAHCGNISRADVPSCTKAWECREGGTAFGGSWLPVYKVGPAHAGQPSVTIGSRRYYQDPSF